MASHFDVVITGAGPAGASCALALRHSGLRVLLVDKHSFPRDKVCGDAIPHRAVSVLQKIAPEAYQSLPSLENKVRTRGCRVVAPNRRYVDISFRLEGYTSARLDFDNFLFERVAADPRIEVVTGRPVESVAISDDGVTVNTGPKRYTCAAVVGADGAHSVIEKQTTARKQNPLHYSGAVRAYYNNVADAVPGMMEIHLFREFPAAYFWIFPLTGNVCNVGLGMLSERISAMKLSLKNTLTDIVTLPGFLGHRFAHAELDSEPTGFGLPMGSLGAAASGHRFLLIGDAASLIDPATGEGIGNAMLSGMLAAKQLTASFEKNDFLADTMKNYDADLYRHLGHEFKAKHRLQRILATRPGLVNLAISMASRHKGIRHVLQRWF